MQSLSKLERVILDQIFFFKRSLSAEEFVALNAKDFLIEDIDSLYRLHMQIGMLCQNKSFLNLRNFKKFL